MRLTPKNYQTFQDKTFNSKTQSTNMHNKERIKKM